jgi:hypothetical protein
MIARDRPSSGLPDLLLERYRLGELPPHEAERVRALVADNEALRSRLRDLDGSDAMMHESDAPGRLARDVVRRVGAGPVRARTAPWHVARWALPAAVAAGLAIAALGPTSDPRGGTPVESDGERVKGSSALVVYRSTGAGSETLADNETVRAGDVIRVAYRATAPEYGAIISVDGRGLATLHLPQSGPQAAALEPGHTVLLDRAFELDDAPLFERFYLVTGPVPFEVAPVVDAVRRAAAAAGGSGPLDLPDGFSHTTFSLLKDTRP